MINSGNFTPIFCKSTDTKPTGPEIPNGTVIIEVDTYKADFYDAETNTWPHCAGGNGAIE